jgi:uncharacterized membrane protein YeaQ/YmgE (transglycosylase-associated protein family)
MSWIWMIVIGFFAGLIARALKPGNDKMGFIMTTLVGIAGSLAAGWLGRTLGWYDENEPVGFVASVLGAIVLLILYGLFAKNRRAAPPA